MSSFTVLDELEHLRDSLSQLVADISAGNISFANVLGLVDDDRTYLYVVKALEAVGGVGKVRARRMLDDLGIAEQARILDLTETQRHGLIERLSS
jgi:hypothetical protein